MATAAASDALALETIALLESRLRRLQYLVTGQGGTEEQSTPAAAAPTTTTPPEKTVIARVAQLERELDRLCTKSPALQEILQLDARHPEWFRAPPPADEAPPTTQLNADEQLSVVRASATLFSTTSSQLSAVFDLAIPPAESFAALIDLQPRIEQWRARQQKQAREVARLAQRSAAVLERWYEVAVVGGGECWAEWDGRVARVEQAVRRAENAKAREHNTER
ncbi:MAG: hypothetical protein M1826_001046 [Phylliscum demangeonii]|nr:MAG: hypothetical protein M1826_001046 [Phylliscum demangeonii]